MGIIRVKTIEGMSKENGCWKIRRFGKGKALQVGIPRGNMLFSKMLEMDVRTAEKAIAGAQKNEDIAATLRAKRLFSDKYGPVREEAENAIFGAWMNPGRVSKMVEFAPLAVSYMKGIAMGWIAATAYFMLETPSHIVSMTPLNTIFDSKEARETFGSFMFMMQIAGGIVKVAIDALFHRRFSAKARDVFKKAGILIGETEESD